MFWEKAGEEMLRRTLEVEMEWEAARELLQAALDGVNEPIMVIGLDYQVKLMNRAVRENYLRAGASESLCCYQVSHHRDTPCDGKEHPCPLAQVRESLHSVTVVHEHYRQDGEKRFVEIIASPLFEKDGILTGIIESACDITERKRAEEYLQLRNLELAALNALAQALAGSLELQDLLDEALSRTVHTLGFAGGLVSLADERTGDLMLSSYTGLPLSLIEHLEAQSLSGTLCDFVYRERRPLGLEDLRQGALVDVHGLLKAGLQSYVGAPIIYKERVLGTFCLFDTAPRPISESDYALLTAIGQQIGVAVENAR
ncbi:MAG TPA: GAF domain-containing protein, partial [Anaerolineae bacterium]|nr:GAF domain-containing protein [Anaerolineae bacterium]